MFIDDAAYLKTINANLTKPEAVAILYKEIIEMFKKHVGDNLNELSVKGKSSSKDIKAVIDKTFNLYDSYIRQCKDSKVYQANVVGTTFEKYSFKQSFLKSPELNKFYKEL